MSAIGGPDEHSHTPQHSETSEHNYGQMTSGYDQNYEPEREFVLMPLFRRIGEMLGLRRNREAEYIYEPENTASADQNLSRVVEFQEQSVLPETAIQYSEPQWPAESRPSAPVIPMVTEEHHQPTQSWADEEEDVLQLESETPHIAEPVVQQSTVESHEIAAEPQALDRRHESPVARTFADEAAHEPVIATRDETPETERTESVVEEWPAPPAQVAGPATLPSRQRNPDEVRQLVAPLREAAVKITAIMAQVAEWLRAKEEEFLKSAETNVVQANARQESAFPSAASDPLLPAEAEPIAAQQTDVASLQPEPVWREHVGDSSTQHELRPVPIQFVAKPDRPLSASSVPFWKRVNWAEEFTPKRVAVLGGLAMAVLLVLGISLARRPASSVLPEQQAHSIQPGGVTVTTHPSSAPMPAKVAHKTAASDGASAIPQQHRSRRARTEAYDDEPDVVVHHYDIAKKPSPVKQTNVAGVRHYSDM